MSSTRPVSKYQPSSHDLQFDAATGFINSHLGERIRLRDVSTAAGVCTRTLEYLFLRRCGVTPMAFVKRERLRLANRLLERADPQTESVGSIARHCGFTHMSQFSADYKRQMGESPSQTLNRAHS
jgi:transcriptional regulator GlxA family with amidase domain